MGPPRSLQQPCGGDGHEPQHERGASGWKVSLA